MTDPYNIAVFLGVVEKYLGKFEHVISTVIPTILLWHLKT